MDWLLRVTSNLVTKFNVFQTKFTSQSLRTFHQLYRSYYHLENLRQISNSLQEQDWRFGRHKSMRMRTLERFQSYLKFCLISPCVSAACWITERSFYNYFMKQSVEIAELPHLICPECVQYSLGNVYTTAKIFRFTQSNVSGFVSRLHGKKCIWDSQWRI